MNPTPERNARESSGALLERAGWSGLDGREANVRVRRALCFGGNRRLDPGASLFRHVRKPVNTSEPSEGGCLSALLASTTMYIIWP